MTEHPLKDFSGVEVIELIPDTEAGAFIARVWTSRDDQARLLPPDGSGTGPDISSAVRQAMLRFRISELEYQR